jgi:hypothetical protein
MQNGDKKLEGNIHPDLNMSRSSPEYEIRHMLLPTFAIKELAGRSNESHIQLT